MRHQKLLHNEQSALVIIDVQEKFRNHISTFEPMVKNIVRLVNACKILSIPIFVTEQYPKGLGVTILEIQNALDAAATEKSEKLEKLEKSVKFEKFEKSAFSSCASEEFLDALDKSGRWQLIVCGIEAHVCVNQTVHDLIASDYSVHLVEDAVSSRDLANKETALRKMALAGAIPSCTEMALLELVRDSADPNFKVIQNLIR